MSHTKIKLRYCCPSYPLKSMPETFHHLLPLLAHVIATQHHHCVTPLPSSPLSQPQSLPSTRPPPSSQHHTLVTTTQYHQCIWLAKIIRRVEDREREAEEERLRRWWLLAMLAGRWRHWSCWLLAVVDGGFGSFRWRGRWTHGSVSSGCLWRHMEAMVVGWSLAECAKRKG